jgi:hypothetical protein
MKSRTRIGHFDTGIVILAWQNYRPELFHRTTPNDNEFHQDGFNRSDNRFVGAVLHP